MAELKEFQLAAVDRIVGRLADARGSRRFLLADEVGLGKTLVAKGVIDELRNRRPRNNFTVAYICSNSEIADQNRDKLCDQKKSAVPGRLTLLSLQSNHINQSRTNEELQVFAFTPGTSLQFQRKTPDTKSSAITPPCADSTGIAQERRLLLYLLVRVWRKRVNRAKWREFFRCSAGEERWHQEARFRRLKEDFSRKIAGDLQAHLKNQWESQKIRLINLESGKEESCLLPDCIDKCVEDFFKRNGKPELIRKNRNRIIGELRRGLAIVSLEFLEPDLIILDEFQRFSHILQESRTKGSIVGKLFSKGTGAILILSATPYKMYTLAHENEDHHQDFLKTLAFLTNESLSGPNLIAIRKDLAAFRERLTHGDWTVADDPLLVKLRGQIEDRLKKVMCRTERNWYLEDSAKGIREIPAEPEVAMPQKSELVEYVHLRQFLLGRKIGDWNITDFWKSSPSVLSFMDGQYALINQIRRERLSVPRTVLRTSNELSEVATDNAKVRLLFNKVFGQAKTKDIAGGWKYLWVRPTYTYYKDTFYLDCEPTKFLVFSHWRFVPKAVSVLTSHEAFKRIGRPRRRLQSTPLQFKEKLAFYPFDACYPSLVLADCVNQLRFLNNVVDLPTEKQLFAIARSVIKDLLKKAKVDEGETRTAPLWKIMARVEARSEFGTQIKEGLRHAQRWQETQTTEHLSQHAKQYLVWMEEDNSPLMISSTWLNRLTKIALYSPAVSVLRSFLSVPRKQPTEAWPAVLKYCLGPLRHYFNKRLVQIIIRRHGPGESYTERILSYCRQAHFQAVVDEYAYLVHHVLQQDDPEKFLAHMERAMGMWSGSPGVNEPTPSGRISGRPLPTPAHFALAFGDDVSNESTKADGKTRKSAVREAFNSPFWPFVLTTTSVGQEGLDFHLYCRDIVHWNLPSNPVDLEQREGRINRYDGLSIRRNIARDFPLVKVCPQTVENLWISVFRSLTEKSHGNGRFKHGLFPHWIYQAQVGHGIAPEQSIIRRHLLFYAGSRDRPRYSELKNALALYRLVFGQPRQQDIIEQVLAKHHDREPQELHRSLAKYMINLSPFSPAHAIKRANIEAQRLLRDPESLYVMLQDVPKHMLQVPQPVLNEIQEKVADLVLVASGHVTPIDEGRRRRALAAILYLLDPYDAVHDRHGVLGYVDDIEIIREAHSGICVKES